MAIAPHPAEKKHPPTGPPAGGFLCGYEAFAMRPAEGSGPYGRLPETVPFLCGRARGPCPTGYSIVIHSVGADDSVRPVLSAILLAMSLRGGPSGRRGNPFSPRFPLIPAPRTSGRCRRGRRCAGPPLRPPRAQPPGYPPRRSRCCCCRWCRRAGWFSRSGHSCPGTC